MKLITYTQGADPRPGLALTERVGLDLMAADPELPGNWHALYSELDRVRAICDRNLPLAEGLPMDEPSAWTLPFFELATAQLLAPILLPSKIIGVGLNYRDHAEEQNKPLPERPLLFAKAPSCLQAPGAPIALPSELTQVDAEAELALVIGRPGRGITRAQAKDHIVGYTCFNDVSDREAQYGDKQWFRGKSLDTGGPCGPWIVTADELPEEARGLRITGHWDDILMQESNTDQLIFGPWDLVEYVSRHMTLFPGDIISTGTPGGVGVFRDPQVFLRPGLEVTVAVDRIGTLRNPVTRL